LAMLLQKLLKGLEGGGGRGAGDGAGSGTGAGTGGAGTSGTAPPAPLPAWKMRLYALAASLSNASGLAKVMGWQQANYLRNMIDMFERGDVAEALRHAIPIDGIPGSERQALGNLQARSTLDITPQGGTVSTIGLDGETQNYLRQSYRKLFQRLEREGRIDEATFVLAELLHCGAEACDFLERHKRHEQAAQLAETLALTPQLRIRLWLLAGDTERALRIARLHRSYADTVRELERTQHAAAPALRMMWATYLAERGDLIEAAEALWPLEAMRAGALEWLLEAERTGRTLGARALVRKLSLLPESLADSAAAIGALLAADGDEGVLLRATLARELIAIEQHSSATRRLAGAALPYVLAERISGHNQLAKRELNKLVELVGPGLLKADLPNISVDHAAAGRPLSALQSPLQAHGSQAGLLPIHDARRLPDGHYLLALGERGVTRVTAQGKIVVHFPLPAYHLVLSQNGERALALARRGAVVRVSRIDLTSCKVSDWLSHAFDAWSDRFDGAVWNAVIDNRVVAIDTTKEGLSVIWQVAELPGTVIGFQENDHYQVILMKKDDQLHQWRYALPGRRMMQRDLVAALPLHTGVLAQPGFPAPLQLSLGEQGPDSKTATFTRVAGTSFTTALGSYEHVTHAEARDDWVLLHTYDNDEHYRCLVLNSSGSKVVAQLMLDDANGPAASANDDHLLLFDRSGRLLDVDCATGAVHALTLS
ncbi:MAG: hypothetical protein ACJ8GW_14560, partial [Massilia sp.]